MGQTRIPITVAGMGDGTNSRRPLGRILVGDDKIVVLTAQEFKTLQFLVQNADRVISRDELLNEVWGYQNYPSTRTVDNHILKLRQKLERDPASPVHFRTVHGMGYKFVR